MEIWKDVVGYEQFYEVSNYGRVRCKEEIIKYPDGHIQIKKARLMMGAMRNGYHHIDVKINDTRKSLAAHRLVATAFLPNPENKEQVNHINGDKLDNLVENLEWVTRNENMQHAHDTGLIDRRKISKQIAQYDLDWNLIKIHPSSQAAARSIGIPNGGGNIRKAVKQDRLHAYNYRWKYVE